MAASQRASRGAVRVRPRDAGLQPRARDMTLESANRESDPSPSVLASRGEDPLEKTEALEVSRPGDSHRMTMSCCANRACSGARAGLPGVRVTEAPPWRRSRRELRVPEHAPGDERPVACTKEPQDGTLGPTFWWIPLVKGKSNPTCLKFR